MNEKKDLVSVIFQVFLVYLFEHTFWSTIHPRNSEWCKIISDGIHNYWSHIEPKKNVGQDGTTIEDIML